jgi:hypothetical protein
VLDSLDRAQVVVAPRKAHFDWMKGRLAERDGQDDALFDDAHLVLFERAIGVLADPEEAEEGADELRPEAGVLELVQIEQVEDARELVQGQRVLGLDLVDLAEVVEESVWYFCSAAKYCGSDVTLQVMQKAIADLQSRSSEMGASGSAPMEVQNLANLR